MDNTYLTPFTKAVLTAVFTGIVATVLCLIYNIFFRYSSGFQPSDFINVSSLIFAVNLLFLVIGVIFYGFLKLSKRGDLIFMIVFLALTVLLSFMAAGTHRWDAPQLNTEFHELFLPMIILMGLLAAVGIPFLFRNKKFEDAVL